MIKDSLMIVNVASGWINYMVSQMIRSWYKLKITEYDFNRMLIHRGISVNKQKYTCLSD
jgi:hypothetical protein